MEDKIIEIKGNVLFYKAAKPSLSTIKNFDFNIELWDRKLKIDHTTLTLENKKEFDIEVNWAIKNNLKMINQSGVYPYDYCNVDSDFDDNLSMHFCSIEISSKGKIVMVAPRHSNDATSKYLVKYGKQGIHHLGVEINDIEEEIIKWRKLGFMQLSNIVEDNGLTQVFIKNDEGQIIELLKRTNDLQETFTCNNANKLRVSENK